MLGHHSPGGYPAYSPLSRPPPGTFSPFPAQLVYWPGCGYPSPPMSPNNYYVPGGGSTGHVTATPSSLLTPTSSISSLSNGVTSGHSSPPLPQQQQNNLVKQKALKYITYSPDPSIAVDS